MMKNIETSQYCGINHVDESSSSLFFFIHLTTIGFGDHGMIYTENLGFESSNEVPIYDHQNKK
ncbi:uncharacterized protein DS421_11g320470 [Arachis hypogaea]|nr:uncharacterized protein DS421_11g320470 [Arachis hypogaea]